MNTTVEEINLAAHGSALTRKIKAMYYLSLVEQCSVVGWGGGGGFLKIFPGDAKNLLFSQSMEIIVTVIMTLQTGPECSYLRHLT